MSGWPVLEITQPESSWPEKMPHSSELGSTLPRYYPDTPNPAEHDTMFASPKHPVAHAVLLPPAIARQLRQAATGTGRY